MSQLPEQTPEERARRIELAKIREAKEDAEVLEMGIKLERDSCAKCLEMRERDERNYTGDRCFCSAAHSYEVNNIRKDRAFVLLRKKIFDTIYQWGRAGVVADENSPAIKELLDNLEDRWY